MSRTFANGDRVICRRKFYGGLWKNRAGVFLRKVHHMESCSEPEAVVHFDGNKKASLVPMAIVRSEWTTKKPTGPGWYWMDDPKQGRHELVVICCDMEVWIHADTKCHSLDDFPDARWIGPIEEPTP